MFLLCYSTFLIGLECILVNVGSCYTGMPRISNIPLDLGEKCKLKHEVLLYRGAHNVKFATVPGWKN